jgi:hypothetical protein
MVTGWDPLWINSPFIDLLKEGTRDWWWGTCNLDTLTCYLKKFISEHKEHAEDLFRICFNGYVDMREETAAECDGKSFRNWINQMMMSGSAISLYCMKLKLSKRHTWRLALAVPHFIKGNSSVSIVTVLRTGRSGVWFPAGVSPDRLWGPPSKASNRCWGYFLMRKVARAWR